MMDKYRLVPTSEGGYDIEKFVGVGHGEHAWTYVTHAISEERAQAKIDHLSRPIIEKRSRQMSERDMWEHIENVRIRGECTWFLVAVSIGLGIITILLLLYIIMVLL